MTSSRTRTGSMTGLTACAFAARETAARAEHTLPGLQDRRRLCVHDAAVVRWCRPGTAPATGHLRGLAGAGALGDAFSACCSAWRSVSPSSPGMATLRPALLSSVGIDDAFLARVRDAVTPGRLALFVRGEDRLEAACEALARAQPAPPIDTQLSHTHQLQLRELFSAR